jgi:hypothetical protein
MSGVTDQGSGERAEAMIELLRDDEIVLTRQERRDIADEISALLASLSRKDAALRLAIAVALATHMTENSAGDAVGDDVWTLAHERGLIQTMRDETGEGWTRSTIAGEAFLFSLLSSQTGDVDV